MGCEGAMGVCLGVCMEVFLMPNRQFAIPRPMPAINELRGKWGKAGQGAMQISGQKLKPLSAAWSIIVAYVPATDSTA